jgi:hypothetical protein
MINRISIFAISVMLSGMFTAPSYAQTANWTGNPGRSDALLSIVRMIDGTNQTIAPGAARISGSLNQDKSDPALSTFAFSIYPATSSLPAASFLLYQNPGKSPTDFSHLFAGDYEADRSTGGLLQTDEIKTLFFTRSSLQLVQLWDGRLRVDGFMGTLNMQNVQLGLSASGGLRDFHLPRESYLRGPRSMDLYGLSVSLHLGRNASTKRPLQVRRCLSRIVGNVLS